MIAKGTGAIEIKSGYGLTLEDELKMLRVIRRVKENSPPPSRRPSSGRTPSAEPSKAGRMNMSTSSARR